MHQHWERALLLTKASYIKELADRLNTLETQIQNPHTPSQSGYEYLGMSDQNLGGLPDLGTPSHFARKRTHSMSEGLQDPYGSSHRPSMGWPGQDSQRGIYDVPFPSSLETLTVREGDQMTSNGAYRRSC